MCGDLHIASTQVLGKTLGLVVDGGGARPRRRQDDDDS
jgi:hypothetical protein